MMKIYTPSTKRNLFLLIPLFAILLASCGSYEQASYYDNDGIYQRNSSPYTKKKKQEREIRDDDAIQYENYFAQKAREYEQILNEDGTIFTDIDSYASAEVSDSLDIVSEYINEYESGNPGWGENPEGIVLNVYNNPGFGFGFGGFGFNRFGFGFNRFGFGGFYDPFFYGGGFGFPYYGGFGFPYYGGFGFNRFGFGFNRFGFGPFYYGNHALYASLFYSRFNNFGFRNGFLRSPRSFAFSNSRRNVANRGRSSLNTFNSRARNSSISRSRGFRGRSSSTISRSGSRVSGVRNSANVNANRRGYRSYNGVRGTTRNSTTGRSSINNSTRRSSINSFRNSSSRTRSSSSFRNGSSGTRSSGVRRSSSSRSRSFSPSRSSGRSRSPFSRSSSRSFSRGSSIRSGGSRGRGRQ